MNYIFDIKELIKSSGEEFFFTGGVTEAEINEFEKLLGFYFPNSYKIFLKEYGALSFCGDTYYGITQDGSKENRVPCVLFSTVQARIQGEISEKMLKVKESGYGPSYSIDLEVIGKYGEPVVVETDLAFKRTGEKKIITDSYGDFLLSEIRYAVDDI